MTIDKLFSSFLQFQVAPLFIHDSQYNFVVLVISSWVHDPQSKFSDCNCTRTLTSMSLFKFFFTLFTETLGYQSINPVSLCSQHIWHLQIYINNVHNDVQCSAHCTVTTRIVIVAMVEHHEECHTLSNDLSTRCWH